MATVEKKNKGKERTYKGEAGELISLEVGSKFEGTFQKAETVEITDRESGKPKDVMRYTFRNEAGKKCVILGAFQLDLAFEEVFEKEGGMERCAGLNMRIERGNDSKLPGKRIMGNYSIAVWEE